MIYISLIPLAIITFILAMIHLGFRAPRIIESKTPSDFGMNYNELEIISEHNKRLFAWFIATEEAAPLIIILHGWGSNSEHMLPIAFTFYQAGINVLLLDSRGHGKSEADTFSSLPRFAEDIAHAIDQARRTLSFNKKIILLGHSVGAGAVLYAASKRNDISAIISISAFAHPKWMMKRYLQRFKLPGFLTQFIITYIQWVIGYQFDDIAPVNTIKEITVPTLVIHGTHDKTVPLEDAQFIQDMNRNGRLLIIDDAHHDSVDKIETHGELLINFLKKEGLA